MEFVAIVLAMFLIATFLYVTFEIAHLIIEGELMIISKLKEKNELFQCKKCDKLYRKYQEKLYIQAKGKGKNYRYCPHCENRSIYQAGREVKKRPEWTSIHPDCPKINIIQQFKVKRTGKQLEKLRKCQEDQEFYEKYNDIKVDFSWVENLKDKKL